MSPRPYQVEFGRQANREFHGLPEKVRRRITPKINELALTPRPPGVEPLEGADKTYRMRVGHYRILYQIREDVLLILVLRVGLPKAVVSLLKRTRQASLRFKQLRRRRTK